MEEYINYEMCKKCGGACCKETGCIYIPTDFKSLTFKSLVKLLDQGNISISGQPYSNLLGNAWSYLPYLRVRNINSDIVDLVTTGSPCKLLTSTGCQLSEQDRPTLGLLVKPTTIGGPCDADYPIDMVETWLDYSEILSKLIKHYAGKNLIDVFTEQMAIKIKNINDKKKQKKELTPLEELIFYWYYEVINNKQYYSPEEVKKLVLF